MKIISFISRFINKINRMYRDRLFYEKTGQRARIVGDIILLNTNIKLGKNVLIYPNVQFFGDGLIEIGDNVSIGTGTIIYSSKLGGVRIGSNTMIGGQSYIIDTDHGTVKGKNMRDQGYNVSRVEIGNDCWLACNVTVLRGSIIHDGAVVGAKALVNSEIPSDSINVGIPAKTIKYRS